ncbi:MAG: NfeD family protein [Turicibacter sp.]|nr:NfeD family protein [Turicibacter sp.]
MSNVLDFLFGSATAIWFWVTLIFIVIEIETLGLISVWFVFGAFVALVTSIFIPSVLIQAIVFIAVSFLLMLWLRSYAMHRFRNASGRKNNIEELVEMPCVVVSAIPALDLGEVKLQGKIWRSRSDSGTAYHEGDRPKILRIEGNTIIVE